VVVKELAPSLCEIKTAWFGDVYVVAVSGELDRSAADPLRIELERILRLGGRTIVVDLLSVSFIAPPALDVLVAAAKRVGEAEARLILVADDPRTLRELQATGLDRVFALERSLSAAIDAAIGVGKAGSA
jgi:anti-sigma B factor antagonist